jgi:hypothetical protein
MDAIWGPRKISMHGEGESLVHKTRIVQVSNKTPMPNAPGQVVGIEEEEKE